MIQMTVALTRLPQLSRAQFQDYWFEQHGPLVRRFSEVLGIVEYVQLHSLDMADEHRWAAPYDGVAQVWFASREDFEMRMKDAAAREAARQVREDERRFLDPARCPRWWSTVRRIK